MHVPLPTQISIQAVQSDVLCGQIKPHGAVYGMTARDMALARAVVGVAKLFNVPFMGLAGTCHQAACTELGVPFIAGTPHPRLCSSSVSRVPRP